MARGIHDGKIGFISESFLMQNTQALMNPPTGELEAVVPVQISFQNWDTAQIQIKLYQN